MRIRKISVLLLSMVMVSSSLLGCSKQSSPSTASQSSNTENSGDQSSNDNASDGKAIEIQFLDVMPSDTRTQLFNQMISRFESENPGIKVKYSSVPFDEAYNKVVAMGASKSLPDVISCDTGIMSSVAAAGYLEDLTDRFNSLPSKDDFTASTLAAKPTYSYKDKIYAVPDGFLTQGIFVRTDWLADAGYNIEDLRSWTWDEYFEVVKALTKPEEGRFGIAFRGGSNGGLRFFEYLGSMLEVTSAFPNGNNQSIYGDPDALKYFESFYNLYKDGYAPQDSINWGFTEMVEGFVSGQCATLNQTPEVTQTCKQSMEDGTWTVLPQPVNPEAAKNSVTWGYSGAYAISANSKQKDAAWRFVEWISEPENNLEFCKEFGQVPLYQSSLSDPFFQEGEMKGYVDALADPDIQYLQQASNLSQWGYFLSDYCKNETQKYMAGQQDSKTTLDNLAKWMTEQYDAEMAQ